MPVKKPNALPLDKYILKLINEMNFDFENLEGKQDVKYYQLVKSHLNKSFSLILRKNVSNHEKSYL